MKELAKSGQENFREEISVEKAIDYFESIDESYKVEIIKDIDPNEVLSSQIYLEHLVDKRVISPFQKNFFVLYLEVNY